MKLSISEVCSSNYELICKLTPARPGVTHVRLARLAHNRILILDEGKWDGERFQTAGVKDIINLENNPEVKSVFQPEGGWNMPEVEALVCVQSADDDDTPELFGANEWRRWA